MPDPLKRLSEALADRYAIDREIGRGGMAAVYLAHDLKHDRQVAIKVLHPELAATVGTDRFLHEIHTVARLNHPHILPVHDSGEAAGFLYYVMPFVAGESLDARLRRERQLPIEQAVSIAADIADGLGHAHRSGVVHRDIKPGNIMLSDGHAVIADFGIARAIDAAREERMTGTGLAVGTPVYSSPEQAAGDDALDGRSDIYSLGCVLYEMLSGEVPLYGSTPQSIQARRLSETPTPLTVLRETVSEALSGAAARALAKSPADRWPTAAEFRDALRQTGPEPMNSGVHSTAGGSGATGNKTPGTWAWLAVVALVALAAGAYAWSTVRSGADSPSRPSLASEPTSEDVLQARQLYLQGDGLVDQAWDGGQGEVVQESLYVEAIERFREAVALDPENAEAYAGIATAHGWLGVYGLWPRERAYAPMRDAVETAMRLDSSSANVREAAANKYWLFDWEWQDASDQYLKAVELAPDDPNADLWRINAAHIQTDLGRTDSALAILGFERGQTPTGGEMDSQGLMMLVHSLRSDAAVEWALEMLRIGSGDSSAVSHMLARSLIEGGQYDEASDILDALPNPRRTALAYLYTRTGDFERAFEIWQDLRAHQSPWPPAYLGYEAKVYAWSGDHDRALDLLEQQVDESGFVWWLPSDPAYRPLWEEQRFHRVLARMGLRCEFDADGHACRQR